jgi:polysaccharide biosynthesis/export protein
MKTGKRWSTWKFAIAACLALLCVSGCAMDRALVEKNLRAQTPYLDDAVLRTYRVACPDIVEMQIQTRPEFNGYYEIASDGRINLGDYGCPRIEGRTLAEVAKIIAEETGVVPLSVRVRVSEYKSQHIILFGEINGSQRSVPYRGPETVLELVQRVGGITHDGAPDDVYVVRPHVGDNQRAEVFHVDLRAIVIDNDPKTNVRVQPFDQIHVGETRRAKVEKCIPLWVRWLYSPDVKLKDSLAVH